MSVSENGQRPVAVANPDELYAAVMQNPYLSRFFKTMLYYTISFSRAWDDTHQEHNFDPEEKRDDWTDITVPLYASSGDLIVTADKKLRGAVAMIDFNSEVRTALAREL
jgi:trehalose/maltose hydrolase-like predicted phosphorylase